MPDAANLPSNAPPATDVRRQNPAVSLRELWQVLVRRRRLVLGIEGGLLLACLLYCLVAPNQYDAAARVELRTAPASPLTLEATEPAASASVLASSIELETLAGVLRSGQLAWQVITRLKLYQVPGFRGSFAHRFPAFRSQAPSPDAQAWLLRRFSKRLHVETLPRTLLVRIRFRSGDAALSAAIVNALIRAYNDQDRESQLQATEQASAWLDGQLKELKVRVDQDDLRLAAFESAHGILSTPETLGNGQPSEAEQSPTALEIDALGRQLVAATTDRILCEAEYRAASQGNPEMVIAADPRLQAESSSFPTALLQQIRTQRSSLEQEQAQLSAEHGPNFPRVVEINRQLQDLGRQKKAEDTKLVERFRVNWQTAVEREQLVRKSLEEATSEGMKLNQAATEYAAMRQEADSSHELYTKVLERVEEAGLSAGIHASNISVVDYARQPVKPAAPDLPLYMAITFFAGLWLAVGGALMMESIHPSGVASVLTLLALLVAGSLAHAQAPTPSTSGLPTGVASFPQTQETKSLPNAKQAPPVWGSVVGATQAGAPPLAVPQSRVPMPAPIAPDDFLDISEYHTPEFHSQVRVSQEGTVTLPMIGEIKLSGMDEQTAAHAIEASLVAKGMLLHPLVTVLVTAYAGEDVSVLGEVQRPGVYPYTYHHRLLDLIAAASGLTPNAGRLVSIFHANDPKTPHPVLLDPDGTDAGSNRNPKLRPRRAQASSNHDPELRPGDTVEVSRAGLVYVVGDVIRPGGFAVDPSQKLTVVQALALAWGPSQNAALNKAVLIREQKDGRTITRLNLKRLLRGQDPDEIVRDRDIIYVPESTAKNLVNRTMESAIQSTIGVTIYSALVYSQRY